jgi:predicted ATPase
MKLSKVQIRNFCGIQECEIDFTDELGRVRNICPIVGPNTSGKTSILNAISLCLMPVTEIYDLPDITFSPAALVRRGAIEAEVKCTVRFSDDELNAISKLTQTIGDTGYPPPPSVNEVCVTWRYPDRSGSRRLGPYFCEPESGWVLSKGRKLVKKNLYRDEISPEDFKHHGSVFQFDQMRRGLAKKLKPSEKRLLGLVGEETTADFHDSEYTTDPREILIALAMRANATQGEQATQQADFERLKQLYKTVCEPHELVGLFNTETSLDMEFRGPNGMYLFDGLSSGQQMLLLLLMNFANSHIHRSIVMIDEIELHLHPLWQDRLFQSLEQLGNDNQMIITTHSSHLRDSIGMKMVHVTGQLDDAAVTGAQ